jgi:NitT/TauT family transport system ATP-binding protein
VVSGKVNIRIQNASVEYGRPILDNIDLEIEAGEFVSVVGQTGCGKSTLLRLILGEEQPTRGHVLVGGKPRRQPDPICGYVPQKYSLFPDRTVLGNVMFGLKGGRGGCRDKAMHFIRRTGLQDSDAGKYPHQLSGGMQQRVAIAQALVLNPPVLLMDEAFSALDPGTRKGMQRLIRDLWRESGATIVFVTHNTREAVCLGSRVIALAKDASGERGSSVALDLSAPHLDFDTDEEELRSVIQEVESATTNSQLTQHVFL